MYTDEDLDSAAAAGAISPEAVAAFRAHIAAQRRTTAVDEENFRLVSSFNDIFVVIASLLLLAAVSWIGASLAPWAGAFATCVTAWVLAEFFVRKRHMALPAIVLLVAFVGGGYLALFMLLGGGTAGAAFASAVAALAAWVHWRRFQVPITVAAGVAAVVVGVVSALLASVPAAKDWLSLLVFVAGAATFACALRWDASDAQRQTRRSDVAFWLHLLAAPLLVHPVFTAVGLFSGDASVAQTLVIAALYLGIAFVSLAIDRRALMVSALGYVLYAFTVLLKQAGFVSLAFAATAFVIGTALLVLSAFWHRSRQLVVQRLPAGVQARLPALH